MVRGVDTDPFRLRSDEVVRQLRHESAVRVARARRRRFAGASFLAAIFVSSITFVGIERYQRWSEQQAELTASAERARDVATKAALDRLIATCVAHARKRAAIRDGVDPTLGAAFHAGDTSTMNKIRSELSVRLEAETRAAVADGCPEIHYNNLMRSGDEDFGL